MERKIRLSIALVLRKAQRIFQEVDDLVASGLPREALLLHSVLTIVVPYLHNRLRIYALSKAWPDAPSIDPKRRVWELLVRLETLYSTLSLLSFVAFLYNGR